MLDVASRKVRRCQHHPLHLQAGVHGALIDLAHRCGLPHDRSHLPLFLSVADVLGVWAAGNWGPAAPCNVLKALGPNELRDALSMGAFLMEGAWAALEELERGGCAAGGATAPTVETLFHILSGFLSIFMTFSAAVGELCGEAGDFAARAIRACAALPPGTSPHAAAVLSGAVSLLSPLLNSPEDVASFMAPREGEEDGKSNLAAVTAALRSCHMSLEAQGASVDDRFVYAACLLFCAQLLTMAAVHLPPGVDGLLAPLTALRRLRDAGLAPAAQQVCGSAYAAEARAERPGGASMLDFRSPYPRQMVHSAVLCACQGLSLLAAAAAAAPEALAGGGGSPAADAALTALPLLAPLEACGDWLAAWAPALPQAHFAKRFAEVGGCNPLSHTAHSLCKFCISLSLVRLLCPFHTFEGHEVSISRICELSRACHQVRMMSVV